MASARLRLQSIFRSILFACTVCSGLPPAHADWTPRTESGLSATPLSGEPQAIALSDSARLAAIALRDAKAVAFVDLDSGALLGRVNLNRIPSALVLDAAGTRAYVLSEDSNKLAVIDVASRTVLATWSIGEEPVALALDPARAQLIVADQEARRLRALNPATGAQIRNRNLNFSPQHLAFSADAQRLLVGGKGLLAALDAASWDEIRRTTVGDDIRALAWWDAGALALAVGKKQDALNLIDAQTGVIAARIALDGDPDAIALSQSEDRAFVSTLDDLSLNLVELNPRTLTGRYPLPGRAGGVAFDPLTRVVLVTQPKDDLLLRLDPAQASLIGVLTLNKRLRDIAVNETTHEAAAIADKSDELSRIRLIDRTVQRVDLPGTPQRVGIDNGLNRAVVSLRKAREEIAFVDLAGTSPAVYPERIDLPGEIGALAVDSTRALTVVLTKGSRRIHIVDNTSRALAASLSANDKLDALAIHAGRGTAYLVADDKKLLLLDLATRSLTRSISLGFKVDAIAVDEALDVAVLLSGQTDRAYVLDLATPAIRASFALPRNPGELAIQRETHVAVVTSRESDALSLVDLQTLQATASFSTLDKPSRLAVSARYNQALVLSAERDEMALVQLPNPAPLLTEVVPAQAAAGAPTMTLMVHGKRFVDSAQVRFGSTALATRWQSHSLLFADVPAALLTGAGSVPITAVHPGPGGGTSNALQFQVLGLPPQLHAIAPPSLIADGQAQLITATGAHFTPGAQIVFGTQALITQFVSATQLQATVPGTLLTEPRGVQVSVVSAAGQSNALTLPIEPAAPVIDAISPISGTIGSTVTLTGRSFDPLAAGNSVVFTGGASAQVLSATLTELRVRVPLLAETGPIVLTTARGSAHSPEFTVLREQDASLVLNPATVTVLQGARASVSVNLSSTGSAAFTGLARLSVTGLPAGISARFEPVTLSAYQTGTLVLSAAADAAPGTHLLSVRAELSEAGGTRMKSAPLSLTVQAGSGVTGVAGRFVDREGRGIAGVIARADTGAAVQPQTATDAAGNFLLTGLPAGALTLRFDATPAHPLYPIWPYSVVLESGKTLMLADFVIEAPPSDDKFTAIDNATRNQTITDARFPGVEILLPAGVEIVGWDGVKKTRIAVERREPENLPVPSPPIATRSVYQLYFGTPMGGIPSAPIPVALPNDLDLDPGAQTELWFFDGSPMGGSGEWKQAGTGTVSADGQSIVSDIGSGIPRFCGTCGLMCYRQVQDASPNKPCCDTGAPPQTAGMQVTLATGQEQNAATDLVVDGEVPIVIAREFSPFDSFAFVANYQQSLGINWSFSYDIALLPFQDGLGVVRLVLPGNRRVDFTRGTAEVYRNSAYRGFDGAQLTRVGGPTLPAVPPARLSSGASSGTGGLNSAPTCVADGALYLLRFKDGTQWRFEPSLNATPVRIRGGCLYHLTEMRDPRGRTLSIARNDRGQAQSITTSAGQSVRIEYSNEVISAITDNLGRRVSYTHAVVPNTSGSKKGFGGIGAGGGGGTSLSQEPPPIVPRRLVSASTPEGTYTYTYEDDPELMRLGGLGGLGGGPGTAAGQSILLPDHSRDSCQEQRGGTRIVSFTRPGLSGPVQLIYGKSKRVLREIWPDGTTLDFSYEIAGGCTARPGAIPLPGERHARCQGANCATVDSLASVQAGFHVLGGAIRQTSVSDSRGHRSTQRFNGAGLASEVIDATGQKTVYQRDGANRLTALTDPRGRTWRYAYDERGNRTQALDPAGRLTEITYDAKWGKPTSITRSLEAGTPITWRMRYDPLSGNLVEMSDPENNTTALGYDENARLVSITDPLNHTTRLAYNARGEVSRISDALGNSGRLERDALGRIVAGIDALGYRSETTYNALDQVTQVEDALGGLTRLDYDANNHLAAVIDPLQHTVESYAYDAVGRLTHRTDAKQKSEVYVYDSAGNLVEATDRKGRATTLTYDEHNRVIRIDYPDGTAQRRSYDVSGRLERIEEGGFVEQYAYDALDRLARVASTVNGLSTELAYAYDSLDRLTKRTVNGQDVTEYDYDRASRFTRITFERPGLSDQITAYTWDRAGRLTQKTLPNGIRQVLSYDEANRLTRLQYLRTDDSVLETIDYAYDANGNRVLKTIGTGSVPETPFTASYDEANRLTQITLRPNTADAKTYALAYDLNGNLTTKQNTADAQDTTTYTWDARDRLIAIQAPGITASFTYDALGRRIERTVNGESTRYVYDGLQAIGEIKGNQTTTLLTGLAIDEMIARYNNQGQRVFLTDALGSVIAQAKQDQSTLNWYSYSPYGQAATTSDDDGNSIEYTARENDGTGLYFYRARYYDPILKRFVKEDPIGLSGGLNLYAYVNGNPLSYYDAYGLFGMDDVWGAIYAGTGGWSPSQNTVDFGAGFGDVVTFGLTKQARSLLDINNVNRCSRWYTAGEVTGVAVSIATGYAAGTRAFARQASPNNWSNFSHSGTPASWSRGSWWSRAGNRANGDYIPTTGSRPDLHDLMDATAAGIGMSAAERAAYVPWSPLRRLLNRMPYTPGAALYGGASTAVNNADCSCEQ